jgi:hypothetical protein
MVVKFDYANLPFMADPALLLKEEQLEHGEQESSWYLQEAERRLAALGTDFVTCRPWQEVHGEIRAKRREKFSG